MDEIFKETGPIYNQRHFLSPIILTHKLRTQKKVKQLNKRIVIYGYFLKN